MHADPVVVNAISWNHSWGWHKGDAAHAIVFEFPHKLWCTHIAVSCGIGRHTSWLGDWHIEGSKGSLSVENGIIRHIHSHQTEVVVDRTISTDSETDANVALLNEFLTAIREDRDPDCNAVDNLNSLAMVFAALQSIQGKRRVRLDELMEGSAHERS